MSNPIDEEKNGFDIDEEKFFVNGVWIKFVNSIGNGIDPDTGDLWDHGKLFIKNEKYVRLYGYSLLTKLK
jgi:hypothetical protein